MSGEISCRDSGATRRQASQCCEGTAPERLGRSRIARWLTMPWSLVKLCWYPPVGKRTWR